MTYQPVRVKRLCPCAGRLVGQGVPGKEARGLPGPLQLAWRAHPPLEGSQHKSTMRRKPGAPLPGLSVTRGDWRCLPAVSLSVHLFTDAALRKAEVSFIGSPSAPTHVSCLMFPKHGNKVVSKTNFCLEPMV